MEVWHFEKNIFVSNIFSRSCMLIRQDVKTRFKLLFPLGYITFEKSKLENCIDYHSMDCTRFKFWEACESSDWSNWCLDFSFIKKCYIFNIASLSCRLCKGFEEPRPKSWALWEVASIISIDDFHILMDAS